MTASLTGIDLDSKTELSAENEIYNGQDKTVAGVDLDSEADWNAALTKNISRYTKYITMWMFFSYVLLGTYSFHCRQNLYNNIIKEVFNSMTRIIGWALIALVMMSCV